MTRSGDLARRRTTVERSTTSSDVGFMGSRVSTVASSSRNPQRGNVIYPAVNSLMGDDKNVCTNKIKRINKEPTYLDLERLPSSLNESHKDIRSMVHALGEAVTNQLQQITKRMDDLQENMTKSVDKIQKTNVEEKGDFNSKLNCLEQRIDQLNEKRIQAKTFHHELRRRFECFEHRVKKYT